MNDSYIAGFLDADGHISIVRRKRTNRDTYGYSVCVMITNTDKKVLREIKEHLGIGYVYEATRNKRKPNWKTIYRYQVAKLDEVKIVLERLIPYLNVKKDIGEVVLEYCNLRIYKNDHFKHTSIPKGTSEELSEEEDDLYDATRNLKDNGWRFLREL